MYFQDKHQVAIAYIDYSKAFDIVCIRNYFPGYFRMLYSRCTAILAAATVLCTKVGSSLSDDAVLLTGVIQGSVIRPLMFLKFIGELIDVLASFVLQ